MILQNDELDGLRILGTMLFPNDQDYRQRYVECRERCVREHFEDTVEFHLASRRPFRRLDVYEPEHRKIYRRARTNTKYGLDAGAVLLDLLWMTVDRLPEPSIQKAISTHAERMAEVGTRRGNGFSVALSDRAIADHFRMFRSVSHLWAALCHFQYDYGEQAGSEMPATRILLREPAVFLGFAEKLRQFGECFAPPRRRDRRTVLEPDSVWFPPPNFDVPQAITMSRGWQGQSSEWDERRRVGG
jgi:hypothetical protein